MTEAKWKRYEKRVKLLDRDVYYLRKIKTELELKNFKTEESMRWLCGSFTEQTLSLHGKIRELESYIELIELNIKKGD